MIDDSPMQRVLDAIPDENGALPAPATPVDLGASPPVTAAAQFVAIEGRTQRSVALNYPIVYEGQRIDVIVVRRLSSEQARAFREASQSDPTAVPDMLYLTTGERVPPAVMSGLDADDDARLYDVMVDLLPASWRASIADEE